MKRLMLAIVLTGLSLGMGAARAANPDHLQQLRLVNACEGCDLAGADLSGQTFISANLAGADLSGANLRNADLSLSNLENANLEGANFTSAYLYGVNLKNTALADSTFVQTTLRSAQIEGANFCLARSFAGADFTGAEIRLPAVLRNRDRRGLTRLKRWFEQSFLLKDPQPDNTVCVEMLQAFATPRIQFSAESALRRLPESWILVTRLRTVALDLEKMATQVTDTHPVYAELTKERALLMEQLKEAIAFYCLGQVPEPAAEPAAATGTE